MLLKLTFMYTLANYIYRGSLLLNNTIFSGNKKLSSVMFYVTDRCNARCKHCYIWAKTPKRSMMFISSNITQKIKKLDIQKQLHNHYVSNGDGSLLCSHYGLKTFFQFDDVHFFQHNSKILGFKFINSSSYFLFSIAR